MEKITKHLGRIQPTGQRIILMFRKVPNDESYCLLVEYDRLPDQYKDNLLTVLHKPESQLKDEFNEAIQNLSFGDGSPMLQTLHAKGYLKKVPVKDVTLTPTNSQNLPLAVLNEYLDKQNESKAHAQEIDSKVEAAIVGTTEAEDPLKLAKELVDEAKTLEKRADELKERAYVLDPSLRPSKGRPSLTTEERKQRRQERNRMRREKYAQEKVATQA